MQISEKHTLHHTMDYNIGPELTQEQSIELEARIKRLPWGFQRVIEYLKEPRLVECLFALIELGEAQPQNTEPTEFLKQRLEKQGSDLAAFIEENERLREEIARITRDNQDLKNQLQQLSVAKDADNTQQMRLKQQLETENDILVRRNQELVTQLQNFKQDLTQLQDAHKQKIQQLNNEIQRLNTELSSQAEELAEKKPSSHKSVQTEVNLEYEVTIKYGHLNADGQSSDGQQKLDLSAFDPAHLIQLLLHDNYLLSNIAKQKFIDEQPVYSSMLNKLSSKPNPKFCKEILTTLINYKDLALNGVYVKNYLDWFISCDPSAQKIAQFKGATGSLPQTYISDEGAGKQKIIDSLRQQLQFKQSIEQQVGVQGQITSRHAIESLFYKTLCTYYQKLVNGGVQQLVSYDSQQLTDAAQQVRFLRKQLLNVNQAQSDSKVSRSLDESILSFRKVQSQDNKATLNQIIYGLNVTINAQAGQLREQEMKIQQLQELNKLFQTQSQELKSQLQKKLDILLASTDLEKIKKLTELIEKQTNIIQQQQRDLSILQIQPETASFGVQVTTQDEQIPKLIEAVEIHQRQLLIVKQNTETFANEMMQQAETVSRHFNEKVKQIKKCAKNLNLKSAVTCQVLQKQQTLIQSLDTALDAQIKKPIAVKDTQTDEIETRERQVEARPSYDQSNAQTDETSFAPEQQKMYKDVQTDPVECPDCKKLIGQYIISQNNLENLQGLYQTAIQTNEEQSKKISELNDYKRNYHNLQKHHAKLSADLDASHEVNRSLKKSQEKFQTKIQELQNSNKQLTDTIAVQQTEMKAKQQKIRELHNKGEKNNQLLLSQSKRLQDSQTELKKTEEYVRKIQKQQQLLIQQDKLTNQMRDMIDNQNEIILNLQKKNKTYIKPKDKEFLSSILTEEDIRDIYE